MLALTSLNFVLPSIVAASTSVMTEQQVFIELMAFATGLMSDEDATQLGSEIASRLPRWEQVETVRPHLEPLRTSLDGDLDRGEMVRQLLGIASCLNDGIHGLAMSAPVPSDPVLAKLAGTREGQIRAGMEALFVRTPFLREALPDYLGGPVGVRLYGGQVLKPDPLPPLAERNVLLVNSGGDCRGYNCINFGAYQGLVAQGYRVFGALNGPAGLTNPKPQIIELTETLVAGLAQAGELLLATGGRNRDPWAEISGLEAGQPMKNFLRNVVRFRGGLLFTGGDGTGQMVERIYRELKIERVLFAPASMDADIPGLDSAVGMISSQEHAARTIAAIRRTASSCNKVHVIQTMGGNSGRFPLEAAIATGERVVLIPELGTVDLRLFYREFFQTMLNENRGGIIIIGEAGSYRTLDGEVVTFGPQKGLMNSEIVDRLAATIKDDMNRIARAMNGKIHNLRIDTRFSVLGHAQRQPGLSGADVRTGIQVGRRMAEALTKKDYGAMIPLHESAPLIPLGQVFTDEARAASREKVLEIWLRWFGRFYPELVRSLGRRS